MKIVDELNSELLNNDNSKKFIKLINTIEKERQEIFLGGGRIAIEKQHAKGRLTARERIEYLIDNETDFFELGTFAAWNMYNDVGSPRSAGIVTGLASIQGVDCMVVANDATVKAGAYFEITLKKSLRAQKIALENNIPIIYLVDSAGVFLPMQDQVFPDENHFGRIFYNNARLSANGITQIAVVMGPCVAGGAYLPVMCDKYIIVEGASMFLAGPALVKAAIGQDIDQETLGGATTHSGISGTADYKEKDDISALNRVRQIINYINLSKDRAFIPAEKQKPIIAQESLNNIFDPELPGQYNILDIIKPIVDKGTFLEYKSTYGKTIVCGNAHIGGYSVGIVANQRNIQKTEEGEMQMGGVIYSESSDKASRFIMNCNQDKIPLIFIHDVNGFMVGKKAEWGGIAKDGAKMVNAVSNSVVPKITLIIGGSYGAGNYAMSGRAYNPRFMFAWPSAKISVMGGSQAASTLLQIKLSKMGNITTEKKEEMYQKIKSKYQEQENIRYAAARLWVDEIIKPTDTRKTLIRSLEVISHQTKIPAPKFGVLQV